MTGETAADIINNALYGDLYQKGNDEGSTRYRMGEIRLNSAPTVWEVFNLTENCRKTIEIEYLDEMHKISKNSLSEQEKKNLERLLKQPRE